LISVSLWIKTADDNFNPFSYASTADANDFMVWQVSGHLRVYHRGYVMTDISVNDDRWHHLVVTWTQTDGDLRVYKDGVLAYSGTLRAGTPIVSGGTLMLGQEQDSLGGGLDPDQALHGRLDEIRVYRRAITPFEVTDLYEKATGRLIAHYKLDETAGGIAADSAGRAPNAGVSGTRWTDDAKVAPHPAPHGDWSELVAGGLGFDGTSDMFSATGFPMPSSRISMYVMHEPQPFVRGSGWAGWRGWMTQGCGRSGLPSGARAA
jgi:hypothetical protein